MSFLLDDYQAAARATAEYPVLCPVPLYPALGLNGEEGETCGVIVGLTFPLTEKDRSTTMKEFGDQAWYLANLLFDIGFKMGMLAGTAAPVDVQKLQDDHFPWWKLPEEVEANFSRLPTHAMLLSAGCGAVAEHVKKALRDDKQKLSEDRKLKILSASVAVWQHWLELVSMFGFSAEEVLRLNIAKLADRQARGVLGGSGDNR